MKKLLLFLLLCSPLRAAITFDAVSTSVTTAPTNSTTLTWNHTVGSGCTNALLWVSVTSEDDTVEQPTSVKYNNVNLTHQFSDEIHVEFLASAWYMKDASLPTKGSSFAILVTFPVSKNQILGTARSYCGVDQTTPFGTVVNTEGPGTAASATVTTATGELVVDMIVASFGAVSLTVGGSQTQRSNMLASGNHFNATSERAGAGSSVAMTWTLGTTHYWDMIAVSLKPSTTTSIGPLLVSQKRRRNQ